MMVERSASEGPASSVFCSRDRNSERIPVGKLVSLGKPSVSGCVWTKRRPGVVTGEPGPKPSLGLLHPSSESTHLTCSSNLVITAWTHSTGL